MKNFRIRVRSCADLRGRIIEEVLDSYEDAGEPRQIYLQARDGEEIVRELKDFSFLPLRVEECLGADCKTVSIQEAGEILADLCRDCDTCGLRIPEYLTRVVNAQGIADRVVTCAFCEDRLYRQNGHAK